MDASLGLPVLAKPFSRKHLLEAVEQVLRA
jgi:hypothetical protein